MEGSSVKLGFYDCRTNSFYEIESAEEYQRCLEHYYQVLNEETNKPDELGIDYLYDFDCVLGELSSNDATSSISPELHEY
jgi:hypothetical protein